jgi:EAL domain-containing protein (putative c-di-GMP-specific phosphodiesterase class I)
MARAIISMSETLQLDTIAEGIETPDQIATLKDLGCELGQGYVFAKPLNKVDMHGFLRNFQQSNVLAPPLDMLTHTVSESLIA